MRKKLNALLLGILMIATILAGCGQTTVAEPTPTPTPTPANATATAVVEESKIPAHLQELGYNETGYPIVDEKVSLSVFMGTHQLLGSKEELESGSNWFKNMEKMSNVEIAFDKVLNLWGNPSAWVDQMNLTMASGTYPDVFFKARFTKVQEMQYGKDGVLIDLAPYIDGGYMPNLTNLMKEQPELRKAISTPDGKIYSLGYVQTNPVLRVQTNPIINTVWLDKLGLQEPKTVDELYNTLVAFKTKDPNGNGKADEIPAIFAGVSDVMSWVVFRGISTMGENNMYWDRNANNIIFAPQADEFKEHLKFMNKLYTEGLMHPDSFTLTADERKAIGSGEFAVVGMGTTNSPGLIASGKSQIATSDDLTILENRRERTDYKFMTPIKAPNGNQITHVEFPYSSGSFAITNKCKYPEIAARWADYFFTDEGGAFVWGGLEGEAYRLPDGKAGYDGGRIVWLNPDGTDGNAETANDIRKINTVQPGGAITGVEPMLTENIDYNLYLIKEPVSDYIQYPLPSFYFQSEDLKTVSSITADLKVYVEQFVANAVTGNTDIDAEWDTYVSTLKQMGLDDLLKIYNDAFAAQYK